MARLAKEFKIKNLDLLPRLNNYESLIGLPATIELRDKYKPFVFIMLYIGSLGYDSAFFRALDAARFGLRNPHLGLIAIGNGAAKKEFAKRAEILGVSEQVVFESGQTDPVPFLKSANVLIVTDTSPESEEVVLRGAAAGIPMIMARTPAREDLFVDGESALLCPPTDIDQFSLKLNILMNDILLRKQLVTAAQEIITTRFHEDKDQYRRAYRESIEEVLFLDTTIPAEKDIESTT
jgi:glycosyltransferase involved in cell wall biosynthesis